MLTSVLKSNKEQIPRNITQMVFGCLQEGDYETLDKLLLSYPARHIEKFYEKKVSFLLDLALIHYEDPSALGYLIEKMPQHLLCEELSAENFSLLRSYINVYIKDERKGDNDENRRKETMAKLNLLCRLQDARIPSLIKEKLPTF